MRPICHTSFLACLALLGTCLSGCSLLWPGYLPYTFEVKQSAVCSPSELRGFDDLDGDGEFESWCIYYSRVHELGDICASHFQLYDGNLSTLLWQHNENYEITKVLPVRNSRPGSDGFPKDLLISINRDSIRYLALWSYKEELLWIKEIYRGDDTNGDRRWEFDFTPELTFDVNNDGAEEVLVSARSGFDRAPRGLWAFDLTSSDTLWTYPSGCWIEKILLYDINHDNLKEIILSTYAPDNHHRAGNTDDSHSYMIILEAATGHELFLREMGGANSSCNSAIVDRGDESVFLATTVCSSAPGAKFSRILFWHDWPLKLYKEIPVIESNWFAKPVVFDVNGDGKDELVTGLFTGSIKAFDLHGKQLCEYVSDRPPNRLEVKSIPDPMNGEVVLVTWVNERMIGLGKGLEPLFQIEDPGLVSLIPLESPRLAIITDKFIRFGHFLRTPLPIPYREIYFFSGGAALVILFLLATSLFQMPLNWRLINRDFACGVIWLSRRGKIKKANQAAKQILPEAMNSLPAEIRTALPRLRQQKLDSLEIDFTLGQDQHERLIKAHMRAFPQGTLVLVTDSTDAHRARFLRTWAEGIGRIVHAFKSPASTIQIGLKQLRAALGEQETLTRMEGQSELLLNYAQQFKKVFSLLDLKPEPLELNQLVRRVLVPYQGSHAERIQFSLVTEDERLPIRADREQMEIMLRCLLDNAVEALENSGQISIHVRSLEVIKGRGDEWVEQFAEIEIGDNGAGMDAQAIEQALKPGFSTKERGMGLGLPQAKLIAELHGSEFEIRSQPGVGTTIYIKIPLTENDDEPK